MEGRTSGAEDPAEEEEARLGQRAQTGAQAGGFDPGGDGAAGVADHEPRALGRVDGRRATGLGCGARSEGDRAGAGTTEEEVERVGRSRREIGREKSAREQEEERVG